LYNLNNNISKQIESLPTLNLTGKDAIFNKKKLVDELRMRAFKHQACCLGFMDLTCLQTAFNTPFLENTSAFVEIANNEGLKFCYVADHDIVIAISQKLLESEDLFHLFCKTSINGNGTIQKELMLFFNLKNNPEARSLFESIPKQSLQPIPKLTEMIKKCPEKKVVLLAKSAMTNYRIIHKSKKYPGISIDVDFMGIDNRGPKNWAYYRREITNNINIVSTTMLRLLWAIQMRDFEIINDTGIDLDASGFMAVEFVWEYLLRLNIYTPSSLALAKFFFGSGVAWCRLNWENLFNNIAPEKSLVRMDKLVKMLIPLVDCTTLSSSIYAEDHIEMLRFIYYGCLNWKCRNHCDNETDLAKSIAEGTYSLLSKMNVKGFEINKLNVVLTAFTVSHPDHHEIESHNYKIINVLGSNPRAKLFKCLDVVNRRIVVVKKLYLDDSVKGFNPKSEGIFLSSLSHPNIVNYTNSWEADGNIFLVMEYCEDKLVRKDKLSLSDNELKLIARQIVIGLYYLHSNHVIHSDIKPENLLVDGRGKVKILDFGEAKMNASSSMVLKNGNSFDLNSLPGTPCYLAPEALHNPNAGFAVDIWGLGCVLAYLVTGDRPWKNLDNDLKILYALGSTEELPYDLDNVKCSMACMEVLRACLQRDPSKRPSPVELLGFDFFLGVPEYLY
jgi:hypothetical protein